MPAVTFKIIDSFGRETTKTFNCDVVVDTTALDAAAAALVADWGPLSWGQIISAEASVPVTFAPNSLNANANIDSGLTATVQPVGGLNKRALKLPAVNLSLFNGASELPPNGAEWVAFEANFLNGGDWQLDPNRPISITDTTKIILDK